MDELTLLKDLVFYRQRDHGFNERTLMQSFHVPHGRTTMEFLGAIARVNRRKQTAMDILDQAEYILRVEGDRGWSRFIVDDQFGEFFRTQYSWPFYLTQWTEEDIDGVIRLAKLDGMTAEAHNYFHLVDKAFNDDERRLLGWLGADAKSMKLYALAAWWRGTSQQLSPLTVPHFRFAWNILLRYPEKTDPAVFSQIQHLDAEGLQTWRDSLMFGSRRTLAGN